MDFKLAKAIFEDEIEINRQIYAECVNSHDKEGAKRAKNVMNAMFFAIDEMEQNEEFRNAMKGIIN